MHQVVRSERHVRCRLTGHVCLRVSAFAAFFESIALQPRGIKWSTPLECTPGDGGEVPPDASTLDACMAHIKAQFPGNGARHFSMTNAARDIDEFMKAYDRQRVAAGQAVRPKHIYSVSFGTYLANRFLQIKSVPIRAIVFDSVVASYYGGFMEADAIYSQKVRDLFTMCDAEYHSCGRHFATVPGGSAVGTLQSVLASLRNPRPSGNPAGSAAACAVRAGVANPTLGHLRNVFGSTVAANSLTAPVAIGVVLRLARCTDADVAELRVYAPFQTEFSVGVPGGALPAWPGTMWAFQTYFSEMWAQNRPTFTPAGMEAQHTASISVTTGVYGNGLRERWLASGLAYVPDPTLLGGFPNFTDTPTLMMSGGMDSNTPPEWARKVSQANAGVQWREYPGVTHVVINAPPPCGGYFLQAVIVFLTSGGRTVQSTPCDSVSQTFLDGSNTLTNSIVATAFGGYATLYGNASLPANAPSPPTAAQSPASSYPKDWSNGMLIAILVLVSLTWWMAAVQLHCMRKERAGMAKEQEISLVAGGVTSDGKPTTDGSGSGVESA